MENKTYKKESITELKKVLKWIKTDKKFAEKRLKDAKKEVEFLNKRLAQTSIQITNFNNLTN